MSSGRVTLRANEYLEIVLGLGDRIEVNKFLSDLRSSVRLSHLVTEVSPSHHNDFVDVECESIATYATNVATTLNVGKDHIAFGGVCVRRCYVIVL